MTAADRRRPPRPPRTVSDRPRPPRPPLTALLLLALLACGRATPDQAATADSTTLSVEERRRVREFWEIYRRANAARIAGNVTQAAEGYRAALALNGDHEDALYYLGHMAIELGQFDEAQRAWSHLVQVNPASARGHSQLGRLYMCPERGPVDVDRARANLEAAASVNAEQTGPLLDLGRLALLEGDTGAARRHYEHVLQSNPGSMPASFFLGYIAWLGGDGARAEDAFARAVAATAPVRAAPVAGEGATKTGDDPMLARRERCGGFDPRIGDRSALDAAARRSLMDERYAALRAWIGNHAVETTP